MMRRGCLVFMLVAIPALASARVLGTVGATYPFAEKDALTEIEERAKQVDWRRVLARAARQPESLRPDEFRQLPKVRKHDVRSVDMTYTLDADIPDPRNPGRALYPRGFRFNPLDYMTLPGAVVFLDASDKRQVDWLKGSPHAADGLATIVLTGGDAGDVEKITKRPVFYAGRLIDRLDIRAVPSVARQNGRMLEVEEIHVGKNRGRR